MHIDLSFAGFNSLSLFFFFRETTTTQVDEEISISSQSVHEQKAIKRMRKLKCGF